MGWGEEGEKEAGFRVVDTVAVKIPVLPVETSESLARIAVSSPSAFESAHAHSDKRKYRAEDVRPLADRVVNISGVSQIKEEFRRITTISLEQSFMYKLDHYTSKLTVLMKAKGGVVGTRLRPHLDKLSQNPSTDMRRDAVIRGLILYLGEKEEELFEDCLEDNRSDATQHIVKILVVHGTDGEEPVDVSILLEGKEVLTGCSSTAKACTLLMGLIYALNLAYPSPVRYTFEVFQKLFLKLNGIKLSPKLKGLDNTQIPTQLSRVKSFELFLLGLAVANLEEIVIVNIYDIIIHRTSTTTTATGTLLCHLLKFLTLFGEISSILFTVLINIFRYQKLRETNKRVNLSIFLDSIRSARMVSGVCVMLSFLLSVPIFFISPYGREENITRESSVCPPDFFQCNQNDCPTLNQFFKYQFLLACNLLPLIIVTVTSILIIMVLLKQRRMVQSVESVSGSSHFSRKSTHLKLQRSTIAVLAAMGLFQVDWTLYLILHLTLDPIEFPFWAEMEFFISTSYTSISPYVYGIGNNLFTLKNLTKK
ncbi:uncharacterized protein ora6 [Tautogolabrus adspersus]